MKPINSSPSLAILSSACVALALLPSLSAGQTPAPAIQPAPAVSQEDVVASRLKQIFATTKGEYPLAQAQELKLRGDLPNIFAKLDRGENATVAYFGTSVTVQPG